MIRKFLILILAIFALFWFSVAYLIKAKLAYQLKSLEANNIELTYDKITVEGFPGIWQVKIKEPKVKLLKFSNFKIVSAHELELNFDLSFKKANLVIKDKIKHEEDFGLQKNYYYFSFEKPLLIALKFNKPFYNFKPEDSARDVLKNFKTSEVNIEGSFGDEKVFNINDLSLTLSQTKLIEQQAISLKFQCSYMGQNYILGINSANLNFESIISYPNIVQDDIIKPFKILKIKEFNLDMDNDSSLNISGEIQNYVGNLPKGQFFVSLNNYTKVIDKLISQNFIISKSILKQIIARTLVENKHEVINNYPAKSRSNQASFEMQFCDEGIKIGTVSLFDPHEHNSESSDEIAN